MLRVRTIVLITLAAGVSWCGQPAQAGEASIGAFDDASASSAHRQSLFIINGSVSRMSLSLLVGGFNSPLDGELILRFGDRTTDVALDPREVAVTVDEAVCLATDWDPDNDFLDEPMVLIRDPAHRSGGAYNRRTGAIWIRLFLARICGQAPVPMPLVLRGTLMGDELRLAGCNEGVIDAEMCVDIHARRALRRGDTRYSTEIRFPAAGTGGMASFVSDGDLLSANTCVLLTNHELTANLGIMPVVPDLGLDAVTWTSWRPIMFSLEESVWSETLGPISDGDLLSITGRIVRTNRELIAAFGHTGTVGDVGLDGVHVATTRMHDTGTVACCGDILFSVERRFFSGVLGRWIGHGDLLCDCGCVVRTNRQLLARFDPVAIACADPDDCADFGPCGPFEVPDFGDLIDCTSSDPDALCVDFGLDAVYVTPRGDIWFSTEIGFWDARLGWISDGDVLSDRGYVVRRNRSLVEACDPLIDCVNFGLDALDWQVPVHSVTAAGDVGDLSDGG